MESNFNQMIKRPLRTMKALFFMYLALTVIFAALGCYAATAGAMNYGYVAVVVFLAVITLVCRYGYDELANGTKRGWMITMVLSAHLIPSLLLPLGVYSFTGLLDKDVRARCLDGVGDEKASSPLLSPS